MPYEPRWETLAHALARIVRSGVDAAVARAQIASAIADRELVVRAVIDASDREAGGQIFREGHLGVPERLTARDFNWLLSQPIVDWETGPGFVERRYFGGSDWRRRRIGVLEVYVPDIDRIWFGDSKRSGNQGAGDTGGDPGQAPSTTGAEHCSDSTDVPLPDDELAAGRKAERETQREGPRQRLQAALVALHRSGKDIRQMQRGSLHRLVLDETGIKEFGGSRSTFDRAFAAALADIELGKS